MPFSAGHCPKTLHHESINDLPFHTTTGGKAPGLAAVHRIDGVEAVVPTPDVRHLAVGG